MPWKEIDTLRGAPGADSTVPGPAGPKGDKGNDSTVPGPAGAASTIPGPAGSAGAAASIAIGSVSALAAGATPTVVNAGTSSAAVLNFGIPAGAQGIQGQTGAPGANATTTAAATTSVNGLMSAADKVRLDALPSVQRAVVLVAGALGRATWTFPVPFGSGVVPIVEVVAIKPSGATVSYNAAVYGDPTNTSVTVEATVINPTILGILGSILVAAPAPAGTKLHITAFTPP